MWSLFETNRDIVLAKLKVKRGPDQEEAIHELRVATKKIRTVFRLIQAIAPDQFRQKKEIARLRQLFRAAGTLRELQVNVGVVWSYEQLHLAFYRRLGQLLAQEGKVALSQYEVERKRFGRAALDEPGEKVRAILHATSEEDLLQHTLAVCSKRMAQIQEVMPRDYDPEGVHKARIYLKEAMYLMGLLHQAGYEDQLQAGVLDHAKRVAEMAGDWHDQEVFYQWLHFQLGAKAPLGGQEPAYRLLLQDLHIHAHHQVRVFRKALHTLPQIPQSVTALEASLR